MLNYSLARTLDQIHYQLWRNMLFAEWMARQDDPGTQAYHVNLVREGYETESAREFSLVVSANRQDRFRQATWEQVYAVCRSFNCILCATECYLAHKTAGLRPVFSLTRPPCRPHARAIGVVQSNSTG